jgi:very-short-patch-repair endonuclease
MKTSGITILQYNDDEVMRDIQNVLSTIEKYILELE